MLPVLSHIFRIATKSATIPQFQPPVATTQLLKQLLLSAGRRRVWWRMAGLGWSSGDFQEWAPSLTKGGARMIQVANCWRLSCHHVLTFKQCWREDARAIVRLDPKCVEMPYHKRSLTKVKSSSLAGFSIQCFHAEPMFGFGHFKSSQLLVRRFWAREAAGVGVQLRYLSIGSTWSNLLRRDGTLHGLGCQQLLGGEFVCHGNPMELPRSTLPETNIFAPENRPS